ncbi:MAG: amidohydrolase family protein [Patescibacteria group bacterium]
MAFDVVIKNCRIVDGTGSPEFEGEIGISDKKITVIDLSVSERGAKTVIDAKGKIVCPGFIDITNHADTIGTLFLYPNQESMVAQGVTTIIGGNCGSSLAPLLSPNDISTLQKWRTENIATVDWLSLGEFLSTIEKLKPGVNFGTLVGFGTLRRGILKNQNRLFAYEDFLKLKDTLSLALQEGAFGLSTGLVYAHERTATTEELIDIASVLKKEGGIYKTHLRSESSNLFSAINEAISIGRGADVPVSVSHFKAIGRRSWKDFRRALGLMERVSADGVQIHFDVYPYITTGSFLYLLLPLGVYEGGFIALFKRLHDPIIRLDVIKTLKKQTLHYDTIIISTAWKTKYSIGKTIKQISESIGISPEEVIVQLLLANEGRVTIFGRTVHPRNVQLALEHPLSMVVSDGCGYDLKHRETGERVHPRSFGAFPRFFRLATKKWGSLTIPEAIRRMTSVPAEIMGIKKRGILAKGNFADIVIFDPEEVRSLGTFEDPYQYPQGILCVLVNGSVAIRDGIHQRPRAGMVIRKE